ncbi:MAG: hydrogenase maturation nickel metallochaperone HypA [Caldilineaceae bacterium]
MHELSIAHSIVEVAEKAAIDAGATQVKAVHLRLGVLSGVVKSSLLFGWEIVTQDTLLAGASLEIEELPVIVFCPTCQQAVTLPSTQLFRCPICDTPTAQILQGRELEVKALELVDDEVSGQHSQ